MAQVICDKLIRNGYSVFMDKRLKRGRFEKQIRTAVEKSRNFTLVPFPGEHREAYAGRMRPVLPL